MHQDLLTVSNLPNLFHEQNKVPKIVIFWNHLDWCLGACWPKLPISLKYFWAMILSLNRNDLNNFGPKSQPFQNNPYIRRDASTWKVIYGMHRCPERTNCEQKKVKKKKQKRKEKMIVMSCTWKIRSGLNKNQESKKKCWKKWWKLDTHESLFSSCKESLFSLGDYVWDEKWPSFITPSLIEKLSIVIPFEPDNFSFNNLTKDHPLY